VLTLGYSSCIQTSAAPHDKDRVHAAQAGKGLVDLRLEREDRAAAPTAVGRDHGRAAAVFDALLERLRAKSPEDNRVPRANARAGQHGDGCLGNHRHVDRDAIALLHAAALERVGKSADLDMQFLIAERACVARLAFEDQRRLLRARGESMAIHADRADVELAANEPLGERSLGPVQHLREGLHPRQFPRDAPPESLGPVDRLAVHALVVLLARQASLGRKGRRRRELTVLVQDIFDAAHDAHEPNDRAACCPPRAGRMVLAVALANFDPHESSTRAA
jgi:hypothetical protein